MKITLHTKNQENLQLNKQRQSTETNTEMTQMLELSDKNFKASVIKMLQPAIMKTLKTTENNKKFQIVCTNIAGCKNEN